MRYSRLRFAFRDTGERARVVGNLKRLRVQLDAEIPDKDSGNNLLLATWNIRDLGKTNRRGFGARIAESHFYIAEILSRFDFVAVQEVNELDEWLEVMSILGPEWDFIATDVTDTRLGGNGERLTYLFDRRKVTFRNIAGEIVLPNSMLISRVTAESGTEKLYAGKQFRRTPFLTSFQSDWFKFDICTVHIYYGAESGPELDERIEEIDRVARYLAERAERNLKKSKKALMLLGDFNIMHPDHQTMKALTDRGFVVPKSLKKPTNLDETKYYDQIAFMTDPDVVEYLEKASENPKARNAGIFNIFTSIFRPTDFEQYADHASKSPNGKDKTGAALKKYYASWKTYQLSDHKPMWVRINSNGASRYLDTLL
jgi:endonuclease/exonuclease/phosphatase family metal-dependent hydrolase